VLDRAASTFTRWRLVPAPKRGELVRLLGEELRAHQDALAAVVTLETGKILAEAGGEVQEMIDVCDLAVGLSRQLYGKTIASERPGHRMMETWHPLGVVGVISAFNFPVAVWSWNTAVALVCGDPVVWKPSEKAPLSALACQSIFERALRAYTANSGSDEDWSGLSAVLLGAADTGAALVSDRRVALVSATGSVPMGRAVGPVVAGRFGRLLLELGGNNAIIVDETADLKLAVPAIVFGSVGTAGQRCTTTRRLIVHESIAEELGKRLVNAYAQVKIGDPLAAGTLMGPLCSADAVARFQSALAEVRKAGGQVLSGGKVLERAGFFVEPTIVRARNDWPIVKAETFAPILYLISYQTLDEAVRLHNDVPQGLASAIFTTSLKNAEY
ncbi:MAG: aldehyde dehydrogenase family protein, partial [Mycobacterium sp.]